MRGLIMILDDDIDPAFRVHRTVDPIKFILSIRLRAPLVKEARAPLRAFIRKCAQDEDCEVPIIKINDFGINAEVLTKYRHRARDSFGRYKKQRFGGPR